MTRCSTRILCGGGQAERRRLFLTASKRRRAARHAGHETSFTGTRLGRRADSGGAHELSADAPTRAAFVAGEVAADRTAARHALVLLADERRPVADHVRARTRGQRCSRNRTRLAFVVAGVTEVLREGLEHTTNTREVRALARSADETRVVARKTVAARVAPATGRERNHQETRGEEHSTCDVEAPTHPAPHVGASIRAARDQKVNSEKPARRRACTRAFA
jgi:hypothetical protein